MKHMPLCVVWERRRECLLHTLHAAHERYEELRVLRRLGPSRIIAAAAEVLLVEGAVHVIVDAPHGILVFEKIEQVAALFLHF